MSNEVTVQRWPWEPVPQPELDVQTTLQALRHDFAYAVQHTAVTVYSNDEDFSFTVNVLRIRDVVVPLGKTEFSNGTWVQLQDIGMCQPGAPVMTVQEIIGAIFNIAKSKGVTL